MLEIDGSFGEGGGQILRTALALSLVTGRPFRLKRIRAGRKKPGLMRQHLAAVRAAATVGAAQTTGARLKSSELVFEPQQVSSGEYHFATGTAGSATLVMQSVVPALIVASGPSRLLIEGGTHNPFAPPFDFVASCYVPIINRMGPCVVVNLLDYGFYPAGGGRLSANITPSAKLSGIELTTRGNVLRRCATAVVSRLPATIAQRELAVVKARLDWPDQTLKIKDVVTPGPGNILMLKLESQHVTELFTAFGQKGVRAEAVADEAVSALSDYLAADVPVGPYLADQLLLPLAIAGEGSFMTTALTPHAATNIEVIKRFLEREITVRGSGGSKILIRISKS